MPSTAEKDGLACAALPAWSRCPGAYPTYGGAGALENALHDSRANEVVVVGDWTGDMPLASSKDRFPSLAAYLDSRGSLDVFRIRITVEAAGE